VEGVFERRSSARRDDQLIFDFDPILDGIPGYAWVFPYKDAASGTTLFKIGVMDGRGNTPGEELRRWTLRFAEREGFRCLEAKVPGYPERYYHPRAGSHRPGLVLVGEAYGIDPLLGEGIAPALSHAEHVAEHLISAWHRGRTRPIGIDRAFHRTDEGKNLWLQWHLAERLYGRHPVRWLHVLFGMDRLRELAAAGEDAYGRLYHRIPTFVTHFAWQVLTRGMPRAKALPAETKGGAGYRDPARSEGART
jgi:flavin-dependent dehydrogenase